MKLKFMFIMLTSILLINCKRNEQFSPKKLTTKENATESAKHTYSFSPTHSHSTMPEASAILMGYPKNIKSGETFTPLVGQIQVKVESLQPENIKIQLSFQLEDETTNISILKSKLDSNGIAESIAFVHRGIAQPIRVRCQSVDCETVHVCFPNRFRDYVYCSSSHRFKRMNDGKYLLYSVRNGSYRNQIITSDNFKTTLPDAIKLDDCPETENLCYLYIK